MFDSWKCSTKGLYASAAEIFVLLQKARMAPRLSRPTMTQRRAPIASGWSVRLGFSTTEDCTVAMRVLSQVRGPGAN